MCANLHIPGAPHLGVAANEPRDQPSSTVENSAGKIFVQFHSGHLHKSCEGIRIDVRRFGSSLRCALRSVVGLGCDGKKQILACIARPGRENLED